MGIISGLGSFQGQFGDHFRVGDHFGVGIISGAVQINLYFFKSNSFKTQQNIKEFLCNTFEFIIIPWSLIFIKSIRCILEVQQDR